MSEEQTELTPDADDAEFVVEDSNPEESKPRGNGVAWLAAFLALLALAAVGYTIFQDWRNARELASSGLDNLVSIDDLQRQVSGYDESFDDLKRRIADIDHPDYSGEIDAVRRDVDEQLRLVDSLPSRMSALETSVASLAGISAGARETFLLAEGEYFLQLANAQLQLANNPHVASLALGMADERITQLSDPALTDVRRAISDELAALDVMEKPDLEGATLTLASLARVVESLPIARADARGNAQQEEQEDEAGAVDKAWSSVKDAMSGLVKVTPPDEAKLALISPDAEYFLRNNIALQLQSARLALLRGEQAIFEQTLDDTSALLNSYFDTSSEQVTGALQTISDIRANVFTSTQPDISGSLRALRQYRSLRENAE